MSQYLIFPWHKDDWPNVRWTCRVLHKVLWSTILCRGSVGQWRRHSFFHVSIWTLECGWWNLKLKAWDMLLKCFLFPSQSMSFEKGGRWWVTVLHCSCISFLHSAYGLRGSCGSGWVDHLPLVYVSSVDWNLPCLQGGNLVCLVVCFLGRQVWLVGTTSPPGIHLSNSDRINLDNTTC